MEQPYGELVVTTLRVVTWNVWGKFGPWNKRQESLKKVLAAATPDLVLLQESWCDVDGDDQCRLLSEHLGLPHHHNTTPDLVHGDWAPVNAIISRRPLRDVTEHQLPAIDDGWGGLALRAVVDGPRGELTTYCVALDWPPQASHRRQHAVTALARLIHDDQLASRRALIVGGDFNAAPHSDEIRMLTGLQPPPVDGVVLFDAWETGDSDGDGSTWSRSNPWARPILLPERRIDYLFTGWPRRGGIGSTISAELIGTEAADDIVPSDHYGVVATLRY
jgi:endonuclease/exonuclease/phosphatase family metal-dependent hydrolase